MKNYFMPSIKVMSVNLNSTVMASDNDTNPTEGGAENTPFL